MPTEAEIAREQLQRLRESGLVEAMQKSISQMEQEANDSRLPLPVRKRLAKQLVTRKALLARFTQDEANGKEES